MSRVLALDYGSARCGCALSDPTGTIVTPIEAIPRPASRTGMRAIEELIREREIERVIVGLPAVAARRRLRPDARDTRVRQAPVAASGGGDPRRAPRRALHHPYRPPRSRFAPSAARTRARPRTCSRVGCTPGCARVPNRTDEERERDRAEREARRVARGQTQRPPPLPPPISPVGEPLAVISPVAASEVETPTPTPTLERVETVQVAPEPPAPPTVAEAAQISPPEIPAREFTASPLPSGGPPPAPRHTRSWLTRALAVLALALVAVAVWFAVDRLSTQNPAPKPVAAPKIVRVADPRGRNPPPDRRACPRGRI